MGRGDSVADTEQNCQLALTVQRRFFSSAAAPEGIASDSFKEIAMGKSAKRALKTGGIDHSRWRAGPSVEESADDEDGLDLPVDPDEGMPLIPDDERVIDVPS